MARETWKEIDEFRPRLVKGEWPTIPELFLMAKERNGEGIAISQLGSDGKKRGYSYDEVLDQIEKISTYLHKRGISKGDKVAVNGKNSPEWVLSYLAIVFLGAVAVPIDNLMKVERMSALAKFADVKFVFADDDVLEKLETRTGDWYETLSGAISLTECNGKYPYIWNIDEGKELEVPVDINENDTAAILFTSGTTGNEKGVVLTHRNFTSNAYQITSKMDYLENKREVFYAVLPIHHCYCFTAVFLCSLAFASETLFGRGMIISRMVEDLKVGKATVFMGIPLLYNKIIAGILKKMKAQGRVKYTLVRIAMIYNGVMKELFNKAPLRPFFDKKVLSNLGLDELRVMICGAGPLSSKVFRNYQQLGVNFLQGYGLTETSPVLCFNPADHFKVKSVGQVLPFIDMIIADKGSDGVGEIRVKGPNVTSGYYHDEKNTKLLFDENGYLKTGDLGKLDRENYCYLMGRAKNIIVTEGGKNVYPEEIEEHFQLYDEIDQILIRGYIEKKDVPSEAIEVLIYPSESYMKEHGLDKAGMEEQIHADVREVNKNLETYKKISKITILDKPMAMTTTKKIKRESI